MIRGRPLWAGSATAPLVHLDEPLSFWGGFDPVNGRIVDRSHPQVGVSLVGCAVAMPGSRGSSGTPGVLAESLRLGSGPAALLIQKADVNLVAGAVVAAALYGASCPIVLLDGLSLVEVATWGTVAMVDDGTVRPSIGRLTSIAE